MPVIPRKTMIVLEGICTVEDAEPLLEWLLAHPGGKVQMKTCTHLHCSVVQTLVVGQARRVGAPQDPNLCVWLEAAFASQ
jgi:hypothetical protein